MITLNIVAAAILLWLVACGRLLGDLTTLT